MWSAWAEGQRLAHLQCSLIYIDCGANKGDSLQNLVDGKVDELGLGELLAHALGTNWTATALQGTCIQAFEMSPSQTRNLKQVEVMLAPKLRDLRVYTETALVGNKRQQMHFTRSGVSGGKDQTAAHVITGDRRPRKSAIVNATNFGDYMGSLLGGFNSTHIPVVMRMDVEGSEECETCSNQ